MSRNLPLLHVIILQQGIVIGMQLGLGRANVRFWVDQINVDAQIEIRMQLDLAQLLQCRWFVLFFCN